MNTPINSDPNRPPSRLDALKEPVAKERTRTGIRDVFATFRAFQQNTLDAENTIDKQKDCHDDPE